MDSGDGKAGTKHTPQSSSGVPSKQPVVAEHKSADTKEDRHLLMDLLLKYGTESLLAVVRGESDKASVDYKTGSKMPGLVWLWNSVAEFKRILGDCRDGVGRGEEPPAALPSQCQVTSQHDLVVTRKNPFGFPSSAYDKFFARQHPGQEGVILVAVHNGVNYDVSYTPLPPPPPRTLGVEIHLLSSTDPKHHAVVTVQGDDPKPDSGAGS